MSKLSVSLALPGAGPAVVNWPEGMPIPRVDEEFIIPEGFSGAGVYLVGQVGWTFKREVFGQSEVTITIYLDPPECENCVDGECVEVEGDW